MDLLFGTLFDMRFIMIWCLLIICFFLLCIICGMLNMAIVFQTFVICRPGGFIVWSDRPIVNLE